MRTPPPTPPIPILITEADGTVKAANSAAVELLGPCVGASCRTLVRAVAPDGTGVCAHCNTHPPGHDEARSHGAVQVRGEHTALTCSAVGDQRVILLPEAEVPLRSEPILSPREREVLVLVARGHTNRAIATRLGLGTSTVRTHMEHLLAKLRVHTRPQAVARALTLGEIE